MSASPYYSSLRLQNFTVFNDASFEFVPGINVFTGVNGAGKTHLLKLLYSTQLGGFRDKKNFLPAMQGVFQIESVSDLVGSFIKNLLNPSLSEPLSPEQIASLSPKTRINNEAVFNSTFSDSSTTSFRLRRKYNTLYNQSLRSGLSRPIFIPTIDLIGHTRHFQHYYKRNFIDFDKTCYDLIELLLAPEYKGDSINYDLLQFLSKVLKGTIEEDDERFFLLTRRGRFPMPLIAEGLRKVATLLQLLKNGFLRPGETLFWDEPEANLNTALMDAVVAVLRTLSRRGVQIFLATHSEALLKALGLQMTEADSLRVFFLEPSDDGTMVHVPDDYSKLQPNSISGELDSAYSRELTRYAGPRRRL